MTQCILCNKSAKLVSKPTQTTSYFNCSYCGDYLIDDIIQQLSAGARRDCAKFSHNHKRYQGETIHFYKISRTYKVKPPKVVVLSQRVKIP